MEQLKNDSNSFLNFIIEWKKQDRNWFYLSTMIESLPDIIEDRLAEFLDIAIAVGFLKRRYEVYCPSCAHSNEIGNIDDEKAFCEECDTEIEITKKSINIRYDIINEPSNNVFFRI